MVLSRMLGVQPPEEIARSLGFATAVRLDEEDEGSTSGSSEEGGLRGEGRVHGAGDNGSDVTDTLPMDSGATTPGMAGLGGSMYPSVAPLSLPASTAAHTGLRQATSRSGYAHHHDEFLSRSLLFASATSHGSSEVSAPHPMVAVTGGDNDAGMPGSSARAHAMALATGGGTGTGSELDGIAPLPASVDAALERFALQDALHGALPDASDAPLGALSPTPSTHPHASAPAGGAGEDSAAAVAAGPAASSSAKAMAKQAEVDEMFRSRLLLDQSAGAPDLSASQVMIPRVTVRSGTHSAGATEAGAPAEAARSVRFAATTTVASAAGTATTAAAAPSPGKKKDGRKGKR